MLNFDLKLTRAHEKSIINTLKKAQAMGNLREAKRVMAILALGNKQDIKATASILNVTVEASRGWVKKFLLSCLRGLASKKSPGRPSKLTKSQKKALAKLIEDGLENPGSSEIVGVVR